MLAVWDSSAGAFHGAQQRHSSLCKSRVLNVEQEQRVEDRVAFLELGLGKLTKAQGSQQGPDGAWRAADAQCNPNQDAAAQHHDTWSRSAHSSCTTPCSVCKEGCQLTCGKQCPSPAPASTAKGPCVTGAGATPSCTLPPAQAQTCQEHASTQAFPCGRSVRRLTACYDISLPIVHHWRMRSST